VKKLRRTLQGGTTGRAAGHRMLEKAYSENGDKARDNRPVWEGYARVPYKLLFSPGVTLADL